jgi:hypothetical protein
MQLKASLITAEPTGNAEREMTLRECLSIILGDRFEEELTRPRGESWPDAWSG